MASLCEMAAQIVAAHAETTPMKVDELLKVIDDVYKTLEALEAGKPLATTDAKPALTIKQSFKANEVICMACGKGGMKTLTHHIRTAHDLKPGQYRKQFGIPRTQSLTAKSYSETRKKMAEERGLGEQPAKAREVRAAKLKGMDKNAAQVKKVTSTKKAATAKMVTPVGKATSVQPSKPSSAKKTK